MGFLASGEVEEVILCTTADFRVGAVFEAGVPTPLFSFRSGSIATVAPFAASGDGQRFLISTISDESGGAPATVVLNWTADIKKR